MGVLQKSTDPRVKNKLRDAHLCEERALRCLSFSCEEPAEGCTSPSSPSYFGSRLWKVQRVRCLPVRCTLLVHQHVPMCPCTSLTLRAWVSAPHAQLDTASSASTYQNSLTGCVGLAANGAGPRRCTAGVTPASVRTRDRRTEARTGPGPLCPRNGRPHPGFPGVT